MTKPLVPPVAAGLGIAGSGVVFALGFPYRLDYAAHALAGAAVAVVVTVVAAGWYRAPVAAWGVLGASAVGLAGELTLFGPWVDAVDVAVGVLGGGVGAAVVASRPLAPGQRWITGLVGATGLVVALAVRLVLVADTVPRP